MKSKLIVAMLLLISAVAFAQTPAPLVDPASQSLCSAKHTEADYVRIMLEMAKPLGVTGASRDVIESERSSGMYRFVVLTDAAGKPLYYGGYVRNVKVYSHFECAVLIIDKAGKVVDLNLVDASTRHPELFYYAPVMEAGKPKLVNGQASIDPAKKPNPLFAAFKAKFVGKDFTFAFNHVTDVVAGSTFSSSTFPGEIRAVLAAFKIYLMDKGLVK